MSTTRAAATRPTATIIGRWRRALAVCGLCVASGATAGCADDNQETSAERQQKILKDPMHYSPGFEKPDKDSDAGHIDSSRGLGRDLKHVVEP